MRISMMGIFLAGATAIMGCKVRSTDSASTSKADQNEPVDQNQKLYEKLLVDEFSKFSQEQRQAVIMQVDTDTKKVMALSEPNLRKRMTELSKIIYTKDYWPKFVEMNADQPEVIWKTLREYAAIRFRIESNASLKGMREDVYKELFGRGKGQAEVGIEQFLNPRLDLLNSVSTISGMGMAFSVAMLGIAGPPNAGNMELGIGAMKVLAVSGAVFVATIFIRYKYFSSENSVEFKNNFDQFFNSKIYNE